MKHLFLSTLVLLAGSTTFAATQNGCFEQAKVAAKGLCKSNPFLGECNIKIAEVVNAEYDVTKYIFDVVSNDGQITVETQGWTAEDCSVYSVTLRMP